MLKRTLPLFFDNPSSVISSPHQLPKVVWVFFLGLLLGKPIFAAQLGAPEPTTSQVRVFMAVSLLDNDKKMVAATSSHAALNPSDRPQLALVSLLQAASANHPSLRVSQGLVSASLQDIEAAKRLRWPELNLIAETDSNRNSGASATRVARIQQNLWDFGRVSAIVSEAQTKNTLAEHRTNLQEQDLHLQVISAWQQMRNATLRLRYAEQYTQLLNSYLAQMQRRVAALASPSIDLELVQSRVLQAQVEQTSAKVQLEQSVFLLEELSGLSQLSRAVEHVQPIPSLQFFQQKHTPFLQFDWSAATNQHPAVLAAQAEYKSSSQQIDIQKAELLPQIYFRLDKPLGTTQFNNNTRESWFIGLSYSPGAGFSGLSQVQSQVLRAQAALDQISVTQLSITRDIRNDLREYTGALNRLASQEQSLEGAQKVLESYQRQFQAGRKSWLDLLNAARELSQTQYGLADTQATLEGALHRLKLRSQQLTPSSRLAH
jgi:outer membrane protein, adhesin transport system